MTGRASPDVDCSLRLYGLCAEIHARKTEKLNVSESKGTYGISFCKFRLAEERIM